MPTRADQLSPVAALVAALLLVAPATAETIAVDPGPQPPDFPPLAPGEQPFSAEEWRALTDGKTLYYFEWGRFTGREHYHAGSDRVTFARTEDRGCVEGTYIDAVAPRGEVVFCFDWDERVCFQHFRRDGEIIARRQDGGEAVIFKITDEPLACAGEPTS